MKKVIFLMILAYPLTPQFAMADIACVAGGGPSSDFEKECDQECTRKKLRMFPNSFSCNGLPKNKFNEEVKKHCPQMCGCMCGT